MSTKQQDEKGAFYDLERDGHSGIVCFPNGWCYGVAPDGRTIYCGSEDDVKAILADLRRQRNER